MMSEPLRCFIAIDIDKRIKELIVNIQQELSAARCPVKWIKPECIHITLKFLGEVDDQQTTQIQQLLKTLADNFVETTIKTSHLGAFPDPKHPQIIWLGIEENDTLFRLQQAIEDELFKMKFKKETRRFSPHITLGRVKSPKNMKQLSSSIVAMTDAPVLTQAIDHVKLYKSTLTPHGPIYESLFKTSLRSSR